MENLAGQLALPVWRMEKDEEESGIDFLHGNSGFCCLDSVPKSHTDTVSPLRMNSSSERVFGSPFVPKSNRFNLNTQLTQSAM